MRKRHDDPETRVLAACVKAMNARIFRNNWLTDKKISPKQATRVLAYLQTRFVEDRK